MNKRELRGMTFYLTNDCNLKCGHCWISAGMHSDYLSIEIIRKRFGQAYTMGVRSFLLTGGEPFMHPNIDEIIACFLEKRDVYLQIESNATLIGNERIERFAEFDNIEIIVSIDGPMSEVHDSIRGVKGTFNTVVKTIKELKKASVIQQCIMAVSKVNNTYVEDTIRLCIDLGIRYLRVLPVQPCGRGEQLYLENGTFSVEEQIKFYRDQQMLIQKYKHNIVVGTPIPPAFMALGRVKEYKNECSFCNRLTLLANGKFSLCGIGEAHDDYQFSIADDVTLAEFWTDDIKLQDVLINAEKKFLEPCKRCIFNCICKGFCRATAVQYPSLNMRYYNFCAEAYRAGRFPAKYLIQRER